MASLTTACTLSPQQLGATVRRLRKARGYTQFTLAQAVGYGSQSVVVNIERGVHWPSMDKLVQIAQLLGVTPGDLLNEAMHDDRRQGSTN